MVNLARDVLDDVAGEVVIRASTSAAMVALAVGATADVATTIVGLQLGLAEVNPIGAALLATPRPVATLLATKVLASGVALLPLRGSDYRLLRLVSPAAVASLWLAVAAYNLSLIGGVAT